MLCRSRQVCRVKSLIPASLAPLTTQAACPGWAKALCNPPTPPQSLGSKGQQRRAPGATAWPLYVGQSQGLGGALPGDPPHHPGWMGAETAPPFLQLAGVPRGEASSPTSVLCPGNLWGSPERLGLPGICPFFFLKPPPPFPPQVVGLLLPNQTLASTIFWQVRTVYPSLPGGGASATCVFQAAISYVCVCVCCEREVSFQVAGQPEVLRCRAW